MTIICSQNSSILNSWEAITKKKNKKKISKNAKTNFCHLTLMNFNNLGCLSKKSI